jgi:hypothetical protein
LEQQVQTIKAKPGALIRQHEPDVIHLRTMLSLPDSSGGYRRRGGVFGTVFKQRCHC